MVGYRNREDNPMSEERTEYKVTQPVKPQMKLSELVAEFQDIIKKYGDLDVTLVIYRFEGSVAMAPLERVEERTTLNLTGSEEE